MSNHLKRRTYGGKRTLEFYDPNGTVKAIPPAGASLLVGLRAFDDRAQQFAPDLVASRSGAVCREEEFDLRQTSLSRSGEAA